MSIRGDWHGAGDGEGTPLVQGFAAEITPKRGSTPPLSTTCNRLIAMMLAYPLNVPPSLSRVSSIEVLHRHMMLAIERGLFPIAAEYRREITRREVTETRRAA